MATPSATSSPPGASNELNEYQLGDSLGKGAFGQVYRALNWTTGETVAVKEIQLSNIPKGEIGKIMSEIDFLKSLTHPNIVNYKGFVKTRKFLYIILEFCENGSLHNIRKKFGKFPENLVAMYISQVLEGLVYLHDHGVIHRDIKGANIFTNKEGRVKLADFGVPSRAGAVRDDAVVGSPYWMAPEVIEQSGATTASDIWSVGCVVIELLEGEPPYRFLDPMPALFRIVQDDCPPIPEGASPIVKDFLYHCFQKDVNLRISAKKLLKHPWIVSARRQMGLNAGADKKGEKSENETENENERSGPRLLSNFNYDEAVLKVQEWNEALKSPSRTSKISQASRRDSHQSALPTCSPTESHILAVPWKASTLAPESILKQPGGGALVPIEKSRGSMTFVPQQPEEETDKWDDDFEEGISLTKLQEIEDKLEAQTIRRNRSPSMHPVPLAKPPLSDMGPMVEDYSDLATEEDDDWLQVKVADFEIRHQPYLRPARTMPGDVLTGLHDLNVFGPVKTASSTTDRTDIVKVPPGSSNLNILAPGTQNISMRDRSDILTGLAVQRTSGDFLTGLSDPNRFEPGPQTRSIHQSDILAGHVSLSVRKTLQEVLEDLHNLNLCGRVTREPLATAGGTFADVYRGNLSSQDGKRVPVAIKQLRPNIMSAEDLERCIASELSIWSKISHPNVLSLVGYSLDFGQYPAFVTEWMPEGTLSDYLKKHPAIHKYSMVCGVAKGLEYLHNHNIVHSDLKCCNIVVSDRGEPKLLDFGHSRRLDYSRKIMSTREMTGTCRWMAIELFGLGADGTPPVATFASDVWSFGMTVLEIISGEVPYMQYKHDTQIMFAIVNGQKPVLPEAQTPCDQAMLALCRKCWTGKVERPSISTLLNSLTSLWCICDV
ncbi:Pkinase-domain-containing protein [Rickenella mellea]|uniref:non-specific serine/threonine protein kinase n=1 Tax=Rickenella mellea TaxID=50990 RepID=A0A4Y7PND7_9AGAM|nr:Pkinase-domain-containing protein [Rickenella mellea]